ncbi:MAG TPA: hypothetical protein VK576_01630, partial [Thermoleophilia bacterium]|nr:hypothetical protein [Thermoleophilia bacterium]
DRWWDGDMNEDLDGPMADRRETAGSERDCELGAAIEALRVPTRDDGFGAELLARLEAADADEAGAAAIQGSPHVAHPFPRWHARGRRRWLLYAAASAAALIIAVALFGPGRSTTGGSGGAIVGPEPATAAQVIRASLAATSAGHTLRGVVVAGEVRHGRFKVNGRETFMMADDGSIRVHARVGQHGSLAPLFSYMSGTSTWLAYDARARKTVFVMHFFKPQRAESDRNGHVHRFRFTNQVYVIRNLAAGPPDMNPLDQELPLARLRANMLQLVTGESAEAASLQDVVVDGRPAWRIATTQLGESVGPLLHTSRVVLVIDRATRLPIRYRWVVRRPHIVYELRFAKLVVGGQAAPDAFRLPLPAHKWVLRDDWPENDYRALDLNDEKVLGSTVGLTPGFPSWLPASFHMASSTCQPGDGESAVSLTYRRGFDAIYVSCGIQGHGSGSISEGGKTYRGHYDDPFIAAYGPAWRYLKSQTRNVRLHAGPFAGKVAHIVVDPSVLPHLWVTDGYFTVTVSGDLSAADMVRVAESLVSGSDVAQGKAIVR